MEFKRGPQNHNQEGLPGPNSMMLAYTNPQNHTEDGLLGHQPTTKTTRMVFGLLGPTSNGSVVRTLEGLGFRVQGLGPKP